LLQSFISSARRRDKCLPFRGSAFQRFVEDRLDSWIG
jgi:hypothetical protein